MNRLTHRDHRVYTSGTAVNPYVNRRGFCDALPVLNDLQQVFVERLKAEMEQAGVSGNQLAQRAKIGQSTVSRVLSGKQDPTLGMIGQMANAIGLPAWSLLLEADNIEQRVIRPRTNVVPQHKVVKLPSPYQPIFPRAEQKTTKYRVINKKKR